ncbi:hypothetical protein P8785_06165 [Bacillus subtilis]|uniref:hypothetical protein n=1 Tax=Bacillus subtilis TaxID=1423 RepID=UPI002DBFF23D|nr:hypothetical protein [Bacillus subtilis]MEC0395430.1 hypothetical protein [Bacillus subtilis]
MKQDYKPVLQQAIEVFEQKYGDNGRNYLNRQPDHFSRYLQTKRTIGKGACQVRPARPS